MLVIKVCHHFYVTPKQRPPGEISDNQEPIRNDLHTMMHFQMRQVVKVSNAQFLLLLVFTWEYGAKHAAVKTTCTVHRF